METTGNSAGDVFVFYWYCVWQREVHKAFCPAVSREKKDADRTANINFKQYFFLMGKACTMITFAAVLDMI